MRDPRDRFLDQMAADTLMREGGAYAITGALSVVVRDGDAPRPTWDTSIEYHAAPVNPWQHPSVFNDLLGGLVGVGYRPEEAWMVGVQQSNR